MLRRLRRDLTRWRSAERRRGSQRRPGQRRLVLESLERRTLLAGQLASLASTGEIHGGLWADHDGDGLRDPGEPVLSGVGVYLDSNRNGVRDTNEPATASDQNGQYAFTGLAAGSYVVGQVVPAGWRQTYPAGAAASAAAAGGGPAGPLELTLTASPAPAYAAGEAVPDGGAGVLTNTSTALIGVKQFQADPRFAGIDGSGWAAVVLDTGIDLNHPFFGPDANGDGTADRIVYQYDFINQDADASDGHGHGSNVASIVGSQNTTYPGMAPGADLIALKVLADNGSGTFAAVEQALQWVVTNAATYHIASVNLSLGDGGNYNSALQLYGLGDELAALANLGVIVVSASGNSFYSQSSVPGVAYPAADPSSLSIGAVYDSSAGRFAYASGAVANTSGADRLAPFSQRHPTLTTVFAPGAPIAGASATGGIAVYHGTSQAAPHIAGIAVLAQDLAGHYLGRRLTPAEFTTLLHDTAVTLHDGDDEDDNVTNTNLDFPRVDMAALGQAIWELYAPPGSYLIDLGEGQGAGDADFGSHDMAAPVISLTAPEVTNDTTPSLTVTATDNHLLPDGTTVGLDVDLNFDGDFVDAGEWAYAAAALTAGAATWDLTPALGDGTYGLRARLSDPSGNAGASAVAALRVDATAPTIGGLAPADDALGVAWDANLVLTFSEDVQAGAGSVYLVRSSDGAAVETIPVGNGPVALAGGTVTIDPAMTLADGTAYHVLLDAGAFLDLAGNPCAGLSTDTAWNFTAFTVNDPPALANPIADVTVAEDAAATELDLAAVFSDPDLGLGDELTYTVTASLPIDSLVAQVSQSSYTTLHQDLLYTHSGDNRGVGGWEHDLARDNLYSYFAGLGLQTSLESFLYGGQTYYNVVGVYPGVTRPNDIYLVGAHYDSVNNPGADDNASGVAAVLELARVLTQYQFDATLVFVAFDREEQGMIGSNAYVTAHATDHILGMLSLDMIAYNIPGAGHDTVRFYDYVTGGVIKANLATAFAAYSGGLATVDFGREYGSDHTPFEQKGFDAALVIEYAVRDNPYYHRPEDAVETAGFIDYAYATKVTRGALGYLATAAGLVSPATLLTAAVNGSNLTLDYAADVHGIADVRVRAADRQGLFAEDTFRVTVTPVNDAPLLDNAGAMTLAAIDEDDVANAGTRVRDILASAGGDRIADADFGTLEGVAVTAVDSTYGTWQYTLNNGRTWNAFSAPTAATARLLGSDAGTRVRFVPAANWNGLVEAGLTFRAWDHTQGFNGQTADASVGGGATAFSVAFEAVAITVRPLNDPPALALANIVASLPESTSTSQRVKVADVVVTDDGQGVNVLSLSGPDAGLFAVDGAGLWLQAGAALDFETNPVLDVTLAINDASVGSDPDGTASHSMLVTDVAETLVVSRFTSSNTGFALEFSRSLDSGAVNLYDDAVASLGPADVILQDGAGATVAGSLVVGADLRTVRFVNTGNPLAPGDYTVVLKGGVTAFRDSSGSPLDGDADWTPGGDFAAEFTVQPLTARVVSLPDIARGAGQAVHVPAGATGWPIRLDDAAGVTSLAVDVAYDGTLLAISGAALAAGLPGDWAVTLDTSTPGVAKLSAAGTTPLAGTNVEILRLTAAVPGGAPYGASQAIRLESVLVNGGAIAAIGDVAVHKAVYLGDADGSGVHSAADSFLVVQAGVGLASGFAAHAWTDPRIIGDADGSGLLSAADAFLIVREGLGLSEPFVPDNPGIQVTAASGVVDPQFQIDTDIPATAGGWVTVPVRLAIEPAATNVGGIEFDLFFDPALLAIDVPAGVSPGTDTSSGWGVSATLVAAGQLRVGLAGQPLTPGLREIAQLQFRVAEHVAVSVLNGTRLSEEAREGWPGSSAASSRNPRGLWARCTRPQPPRQSSVLNLEGSVSVPDANPLAERADYGVLDIEPVDPRAGGYVWTAVDGSLAITSMNAWESPWDEGEDGGVESPCSVASRSQERRNRPPRLIPATEVLPELEAVLQEVVDDVAWVWRRGAR